MPQPRLSLCICRGDVLGERERVDDACLLGRHRLGSGLSEVVRVVSKELRELKNTWILERAKTKCVVVHVGFRIYIQPGGVICGIGYAIGADKRITRVQSPVVPVFT